jgi:hypothetical protein
LTHIDTISPTLDAQVCGIADNSMAALITARWTASATQPTRK